MDGKIYKFYNIFSDQNILSMEITCPNNRVVNYKMQDDGSRLPLFIDLFEKGQVISFQTKSPWALVFAAACLIATAVDYYCSEKITSDVAACTAKGECSIVELCGARCIPRR